MMVIPACEFKACLDSDPTITSRTSINLAKMLTYKILPNTTYKLLELLFYYDTWGITNTNTSIFQDSRIFLLPIHHAPITCNCPKAKAIKGLTLELQQRTCSEVIGCPGVAFRVWRFRGLGKVSSSENPSENQTVRLFFGGEGRNSTHTVQLKAMFFVSGPIWPV